MPKFKDSTSQSRRDVLAFLSSAAAATVLPAGLRAEETHAAPDTRSIPYPYTVAEEPWAKPLGNQRVRLYVERPAEAVWAHIFWRRVDLHPNEKAILVFSADGTRILNAATVTVESEFGDILFEAKTAGEYLVYYLPQREVVGHASVLGPKGQYRRPEPVPGSPWSRRFLPATASRLRQLPQAAVVTFEARTELDNFYPMEVAASSSEVRQLETSHAQPFLLFPEDRSFPIQMYDKLPLRWIQNGPSNSLNGKALRGEFYVFQIGVYGNSSGSGAAGNISLQFSDLTQPEKGRIPASAWECINTGGIDAQGKAFQKDVTISPGQTAALWCGVQIPVDAVPGKYTSEIRLRVGSAPELTLQCAIEVMPDFIRDGGVDQSWRVARIHWLNSTLGSSDSLTSPYTPLVVEGRTVRCLGREIRFAESGFPESIKANALELLASPVSLTVSSGSKSIAWTSTSTVKSAANDRVVLRSRSDGEGYTLAVDTVMEFDGGIGFEVTLTSDRARMVSDIALQIPLLKRAAPYAVGMGLPGGKRPAEWHWRWTEQPQRWKDQGSNLEFFGWLGGVHAGLYCRLLSPLQDWKNGDAGAVTISEDGERVLFHVTTGERTVKAGEPMHFSFRLLPTPVKPMDPDHWKYRYVQAYEPPEELRDLGATVINLHQGTLPNLYINYPLLNVDLLGPYVSAAHVLGLKVKLYYTMRELTTRLPELWAFRSLGNEIYRSGGTQGQGNPQLDFWLQEHLRTNYSPGWITLTQEGVVDTSLRVYSDSRLVNFYLEGLQWLLKNIPIDGLYLDEIGYSRDTMQRVRRVLEERPGAMIDMHGNHDWWSCNSPIGYYMEHLPYIDRLWLGEAFNPDSPPEFWLIEMSGIPFGISSDMLEHPNPWRGMIYGMTARARWSGISPQPIWKLWDEFGIQDAEMVGWWEEGAPVATGSEAVRATAYVKKEKTLIALASWAPSSTQIRLAIDWDKLGLDKKNVKLTAPAMEGMQEGRTFALDEPISVLPGKGWLIIVERSA